MFIHEGKAWMQRVSLKFKLRRQRHQKDQYIVLKIETCGAAEQALMPGILWNVRETFLRAGNFFTVLYIRYSVLFTLRL
jgi:hypothetical protein